MEIKGKIVRVLPIVNGTSKQGKDWSSQSFIIEQPGQYPKNICITLFGEDKINKYDLTQGLTVTAHIEIESREYNGRWYTDVRCWKMEWDKQQARPWQPGGDGGKAEPSLSESSRASEHSTAATDDLPF